MPVALIKDYLQTQGLKLPADDVRVAYVAAQAVMNMGQAAVEQEVLWYDHDGVKLAEHISQNPQNEALLKQIFMALDSTYSRAKGVKSAVVYAHMPSHGETKNTENLMPQLVRLTHQGEVIEPKLAVDDDNSRIFLACRTAQSGWMNIANDIPYWLSLGEIHGERNEGGKSQISAPICMENGTVLGVVHIEFAEPNQADEAAQAEWVALALALAEPLQTLLGIPNPEDEPHE
ncbi:hypothetical protein [Neisseria perflava]|uniref:hypothetical protein n=1 Tax=Neisseria perflava TaxID=33053 RepID=UPI0020A09263|nr:hypothetical protein [Neisseria perflava]MCP1660382.1 hypothetical protein [Neisseria perflava]MCP1773054.1 hypothetical protein [Neisseria perflava]